MLKIKNIIAIGVVTTMLLASCGNTSGTGDDGKTASQIYVESMSPGWNIGNTLDSYDANRLSPGIRETVWGNPAATIGIFLNVKEQGYNSVRIPITFEGCVIKDDGGNYVVDEEWLNRIQEVVDMALEADLMPLINVHHDSWIWLSNWDGDINSDEYKKFCGIWSSLAERFKKYDSDLSFETINEPTFPNSTGVITESQKLDIINKAGYDIIRNSGGENKTRMVVLPTLLTNHEQDVPLYNLIKSLDDENVIATMHYYSEWLYSANLGITSFDEVLWDTDYEFEYTPRTSLNVAFDRMYNQFTINGIGVLIGEFGLLGHDANNDVLQAGEQLKYYDYINSYSRDKGITLMIWDNGSVLNRSAGGKEWRDELLGQWITASMTGSSSYATGLDTIYLSDEAKDIEIPLTLNGNTLKSITDGNRVLAEGIDYNYDEKTTTVTIRKDYVEKLLVNKAIKYGTVGALEFSFSSGAKWFEYIVNTAPVEILGNTTTGIKVNFNGNQVRRLTAFNENASIIGPNDWWKYLQYNVAYKVNYSNNIIEFYGDFFNGGSVPEEGDVRFVIEMYDGSIVDYIVSMNGNEFIQK